MQSEYQILLFYKYVFIKDPETVRDWLLGLCKDLGFKGRLIIAKEGLNITLEGKTENTEEFIKELEKDARFTAIHYKKSPGTGRAFPKLSVKVRSEVVTLGLGVCDIDPNQMTGKRLSAEELHNWLTEGKELFIIDMRNIYEHKVGRFDGSICPPMDNFRDLPKFMKSIEHLKNKTVVTVCTGGVRCEKASGYLVSKGYTDVWQLDGGIVTYMEKYPNEHFEGKLYVFDRRTLMGFYTDDPKHKVIGKCEACNDTSEHFVDCNTMWCARHYILCPKCVEKNTFGGKLQCPGGCTLRRPKKIKSPIARFFKTIFK